MNLKQLITTLIALSEQHGPDIEVRTAYGRDEGFTIADDIDTVRYVETNEFGSDVEYIRIAGPLEVDR